MRIQSGGAPPQSKAQACNARFEDGHVLEYGSVLPLLCKLGLWDRIFQNQDPQSVMLPSAVARLETYSSDGGKSTGLGVASDTVTRRFCCSPTLMRPLADLFPRS